MLARDSHHNSVKTALIKDSWKITHDPLSLKWGIKDMYVDLGAEKLLAAEKGTSKIAVEVKSFTGLSEMRELEVAIGQYIVYHDVLAEVDPDRKLYLAIHQEIYAGLFEEAIGKLLLKNHRASLLVFDLKQEEIVQWIP